MSKKWDIIFEVIQLDYHYEIEANTKKQAIEIARIQSNFRDATLELYEISESE